MALKKKNKIESQFNMSSLTDIIFLLLIFFMLTSSLVVPNALNLKLPGESNSTATVSKAPDEVRITSSGKFLYNGQSIGLSQLNQKFTALRKRDGAGKANIMVSPSENAPMQAVVSVLDLARKSRLNAIMNLAKK